MTEPFDVCGPLPRGVTVLEASAGTGKTWTIAALAARYVAEGTPLKEILLVTFTRMATGELRDRVRERLVFTEQALARVLAGEPPADDALVRLLARRGRRSGGATGWRSRWPTSTPPRSRPSTASARRCSAASAWRPASRASSSRTSTDLRERGGRRPLRPPLPARRTGRPSRARGGPRGADRRREPGRADRAERRRRALAARHAAPAGGGGPRRARGAQEARRRAHVRRPADRAATTMLAGDRAPRSERLRSRWTVVLVDEFQDTDPVQWEHHAPGLRRTATLVLIGDPKQAIYAFRGADVYAYLDAAGTAGTPGHARHQPPQRPGADRRLRRAVRRRAARPRGDRLPPGDGRPRGPSGSPACRCACAWCSAATCGGRRVGTPSFPRCATTWRATWRPTSRACCSGGEVEPGQVAVLVQTNRNAARVREALDAAGIPAVINGAGSVFGTVEAGEWLRLLEALERPTSELRARSASLTPFLGWTAERVAAASDEEWEDVHRRLHDWARVLRLCGRGVAGGDGHRGRRTAGAGPRRRRRRAAADRPAARRRAAARPSSSGRRR